MSDKLPHRVTYLLAALTAVALLVGCGDAGVEGQGAICTPDQSVEPKDCTIEPDNPSESSMVQATSERALERICNSPCTRIDSLRVARLQGLENLKALSRLKDIGLLWVENNKQLQTLDGISTNKTIGALTVERNPNLETLDGLGEGATIDTLTVIDNDSLDSLRGIGPHLDGLSELSVQFNKLDSFAFDTAPDMPADVRLIFTNESKVTDFEGFKGATTASYLRVGAMESMTSLDGLESLETVTDGIRMTNNEALPPCRIDQFVDRVSTPETGVSRFANTGSGTCE